MTTNSGYPFCPEHGADFPCKQCDGVARIESKHKHIANIEREAEILKNVLRDTITTLAIQARDMGHAPVATKYLELREELESIFPSNKHTHTDACYSKIPETEGNGMYLSCGKVAQ